MPIVRGNVGGELHRLLSQSYRTSSVSLKAAVVQHVGRAAVFSGRADLRVLSIPGRGNRPQHARDSLEPQRHRACDAGRAQLRIPLADRGDGRGAGRARRGKGLARRAPRPQLSRRSGRRGDGVLGARRRRGGEPARFRRARVGQSRARRHPGDPGEHERRRQRRRRADEQGALHAGRDRRTDEPLRAAALFRERRAQGIHPRRAATARSCA